MINARRINDEDSTIQRRIEALPKEAQNKPYRKLDGLRGEKKYFKRKEETRSIVSLLALFSARGNYNPCKNQNELLAIIHQHKHLQERGK